jgi:hypothetical protein
MTLKAIMLARLVVVFVFVVLEQVVANVHISFMGIAGNESTTSFVDDMTVGRRIVLGVQGRGRLRKESLHFVVSVYSVSKEDIQNHTWNAALVWLATGFFIPTKQRWCGLKQRPTSKQFLRIVLAVLGSTVMWWGFTHFQLPQM